jgi:hypothetical protein
MLNTHAKAISNRVWLLLSQHDTCPHRTDTFPHAKSAPTQSVAFDGACRTDTFTHAKSAPTQSVAFDGTCRTDMFTHAKSAPTQSIVFDGACRTDTFTHAHTNCGYFFPSMAHVHKNKQNVPSRDFPRTACYPNICDGKIKIISTVHRKKLVCLQIHVESHLGLVQPELLFSHEFPNIF